MRERFAHALGNPAHLGDEHRRNPAREEEVLDRLINLRHHRALLHQPAGNEPGVVEGFELAGRLQEHLRRKVPREDFIERPRRRVGTAREAHDEILSGRGLFAPDERRVDHRLTPGIEADEGPRFIVFRNRPHDRSRHLRLRKGSRLFKDAVRDAPQISVGVARGRLGKETQNRLTLFVDRLEGKVFEVLEPLRRRILFRHPAARGDEVRPERHLGAHGARNLHAALFHFRDEINPAHLKEHEGIGVDLFGELVDHGRDVLAGNGPVRAAAAHAEVAPAFRENLDPKALADFGNLGRELACSEAGDNEGRLRHLVDEAGNVLLSNRRERELHSIEGIKVSRYAGLDGVRFRIDLKRLNLAFRGIGETARNSVFVVDRLKCVEPAAAPPCCAVLR